eukprot:scaffold2045_cov404-Prasinococcus_capsulatus_cf.AAC.74
MQKTCTFQGGRGLRKSGSGGGGCRARRVRRRRRHGGRERAIPVGRFASSPLCVLRTLCVQVAVWCARVCIMCCVR